MLVNAQASSQLSLLFCESVCVNDTLLNIELAVMPTRFFNRSRTEVTAIVHLQDFLNNERKMFTFYNSCSIIVNISYLTEFSVRYFSTFFVHHV